MDSEPGKNFDGNNSFFSSFSPFHSSNNMNQFNGNQHPFLNRNDRNFNGPNGPNGPKCHKCHEIQNYIQHMSSQISLINKNMELINEQIKLLDMKMSIQNQNIQKNNVNTNNTKQPNKNRSTKKESNIKSYKYIPPPRKHSTQYPPQTTNQKPDVGTQSPFTHPLFNNKMFSDPLVINIDDIGKSDDMNPLGFLRKLFSGDISEPANNKKNEQINDNDSEEVEEFSEHNSDEEFEELEYEINSIDDLIKLGEEYNKKIKDNESKDEEEKESKSENVESKTETTNESNVFMKYFENELTKIKPQPEIKVYRGLLMRDGSIKFLNKDMDEIKKTVDHEKNNKLKESNITDKNKKQSSYEINGKKFSINLEILSKLIKPLTKLKSMIGLDNVKNAVVDMILYYLQNFENKNNNMLHTVIEGPPGVGKTQLGKILAEIYAGLGVISSNKFKIVKRSDLVGEYLGHTAPKTQKIIDEADGGVLFIDEAYALGNEEKRDTFSKECIDCINQNLSENKKRFICIIAGYPDELDKCFFAYNPGLKRRFPFKFRIEGYKPDELKDIFIKKVGDIHWKLEEDMNEKAYLTEFFNKNKSDFKYFGGDIDNLILNCKYAHSRRVFGKHPKNKRKLNQKDLEIGFDRFVRNKKSSDSEVPLYLQHIYV